MTIFRKVNLLLKEQNITDVLITGGGIIPQGDMDILEKEGIGKLFGPGTEIKNIVNYIDAWYTENK